MSEVSTYVRVRRLRAELHVLERYDVFRSCAGHDYGCGQRAAELGRRRRELESLELGMPTEAPTLEAPRESELAEAWKAVGAPRLRRAEGETYRRETPSTRRTLATWRRVERLYDHG